MIDRRPAPAGLARARHRSLRRWGLLVLLAVLPVGAHGHNLGDSYLYLQVYEETVSGRFEIALADLNPALGLAGTADEITADNLDRNAGFLRRYYLEHVTISAGGRPLAIEFSERAGRELRAGYIQLPFELTGLERVPESLTFEYAVLFDEEPSHRGFLLVEHNWATGTFANENQVSLVFGPSSRRQELDLTSSGRLRGFLALTGLGAEHLLLGVDHILFLMALLLPVALRRERGRWQALDRFRPVLLNAVTVATAFLVAHSVALSLAALGLVRLPEPLVETVIAASTTLAALHLLVPLFRARVWWIVFGLSLFHGLGFSAAIEGLGVLEEHLGLSLLAFNLGAELGQLAVVAVLTCLAFPARRLTTYTRVLLPAAAVAMILVSGVWVVERSFGVDIPMRELLPRTLQEVLP